jgi:aryl-alcohol dehydrogenase-like predicted oxidoreductase
MDGGAETLVGSVLRAAVAAGEVQRDQVVIVSKFGYVWVVCMRRRLFNCKRAAPVARPLLCSL